MRYPALLPSKFCWTHSDYFQSTLARKLLPSIINGRRGRMSTCRESEAAAGAANHADKNLHEAVSDELAKARTR